MYERKSRPSLMIEEGACDWYLGPVLGADLFPLRKKDVVRMVQAALDLHDPAWYPGGYLRGARVRIGLQRYALPDLQVGRRYSPYLRAGRC